MADLKQIKELNEEKRRSSRRKEFIMAELLETERSYVKVKIFIYPPPQKKYLRMNCKKKERDLK